MKHKFLLVILLFVLPVLPQTNPNAHRLFKSGFETNTSIEPVTGGAYNSWPRFHGTDAASGMSWDTPLYGGSLYTLLQTLTSNNSNPAPGNSTDYIRNSIETVLGPYGNSTKALKMHILKPSPNTCCTQDTFEISGMQPIKDIYVAHWMKFNPEMLSQMQAQGTSYWRMMFEMKTSTDYRIQANIQWNGSKPYFHVHGDNGGLSGPPNIVWYWQQDNTTLSVPMDQWFYTEFYLHRATDNTGRFVWAVNGNKIVDHFGPNYGASMDNIAALMFTNMYGPNPTNWYQWLDDFEVWDLPPCANMPCGAPGAVAPSDTQAPTTPANVTATAVSASQVNLAWNGSTDNVGVSGYRVYRNGGTTPAATVSGTAYQDTACSAGTAYSYAVAAYDAAGNTSAKTAATTATTAALPAAPQGTKYLSDLTPTSATNGWGPYEKDLTNGNNGAQDGGPITLNGVTYQKGLGTHAPADIRYNLNGACSVFAADVGIDDDAGTNGSVIFQVYGDGTLLMASPVLTGGSATSKLNVNVSGKKELRLVVTDGGDNIDFDHADWASAQVNCSVVDTQAPSVPASLTATAASSSQVNLAWTASTDNIGVAGYRIYRNGGTTPIATVTGTTYQNTALSPNTAYSYTVAAYDAAGNASAPSTAASATTAGLPLTTTYLSDITPTYTANGWGPYEKDMSNGELGSKDGKVITLNGVTYKKGLGVHAMSDLRFNIGGSCSSFAADMGVDEEVGTRGSVIFQVYGDNALLYASPVLTGSSATAKVNVNVSGKNELRLVVTNGGDNVNYDHADWADAKVTCIR